MDFSFENAALWNIVIQFGIIAAMILVATIFRRKLGFVRKAMIPTAVLAGFLLLALKSSGLIFIDTDLLQQVTYHGIAIGFIALSLRVPSPENSRAEKLDNSQKRRKNSFGSKPIGKEVFADHNQIVKCLSLKHSPAE